MSQDASPRAGPVRRTLIAFGRAVGLLALIAGLYSILAILFPRLEELPRSAIALLAGVTVFEILRPARRRTPASAAIPSSPAMDAAVDSTAELAEAQALIARLRDESLEREAALRGDAEELIAINEGLRRDISGLNEILARERASGEEARAELEKAQAREARLRDEAAAESEHLQRAAGKALEESQQMRARADELRRQTESERQQAADAAGKAQQANRAAAEELEKVRAELQRERQRAADGVAEAESANRARHEQLAEATQEIDKARTELQRERQRADQAVRELQNALSAAATAATLRQKLESQLADFDRRLSGSMQELEALRLERQRLRRETEEARQRAEVEKGELRLAVEAAANARMQEVVNKLTSGHDAALQQALAASETALADVQSLTARLDEERRHSADIAAQRTELEEEMARLQNDHETALGEAIEKSEAARAESRAANGRVLELERDLAAVRDQMAKTPEVDEKALREAIDAEWSAKLQTIVSHMATDHEADVGNAIEEREAARAEARALKARALELERDLAALRDQTAKAPGIDEKALREAIDAEWGAKLQTIVSHMASDHEADVGKAIEEREAARAEARNQAIKISALQAKMRAAEDQIAALRSAPPPAAQPPVDEDRARADVLEFAEQANAVIRAATSPGNVPLPQERRGRVLFVHHDPALRTMWRDNLEKSGFDVQTAADGLEGLRMTMAAKPDVVVADASMPKMGGRELCQLIKSNQETATVKVVLMSGVYTTEMPMDAAAREFEADELLRKPVKFEALKAALENLLATA